jgi:hypothetical protein
VTGVRCLRPRVRRRRTSLSPRVRLIHALDEGVGLQQPGGRDRGGLCPWLSRPGPALAPIGASSAPDGSVTPAPRDIPPLKSWWRKAKPPRHRGYGIWRSAPCWGQSVRCSRPWEPALVPGS